MTSRIKLDFTLILPTLGQRLNEFSYLLNELNQSSYSCNLIIVTPLNQREVVSNILHQLDKSFSVNILVENLNSNLPKAINQGFDLVGTKYWNWLGDDDVILLNEVAKIVFR